MNPAEPLHDTDAEIAVLGSILLDGQDCFPENMPKVSKILSPSDFFDDQNRRIYSSMLSMLPGTIDEVTLSKQMRDIGTYKPRDEAWLYHCLAMTPTPFHAVYYAQIVKGYSDKRNGVKPHPVARGAQL